MSINDTGKATLELAKAEEVIKSAAKMFRFLRNDIAENTDEGKRKRAALQVHIDELDVAGSNCSRVAAFLGYVRRQR